MSSTEDDFIEEPRSWIGIGLDFLRSQSRKIWAGGFVFFSVFTFVAVLGLIHLYLVELAFLSAVEVSAEEDGLRIAVLTLFYSVSAYACFDGLKQS